MVIAISIMSTSFVNKITYAKDLSQCLKLMSMHV